MSTAPARIGQALGEVRHYSMGEARRRMMPLFRPYRWRLLLAASLVAAVGLAVALGPLFSKYIIDYAIPMRSPRLALMAAGAFLCVMFTRMFLWYKAMRLVYRTQQAVVFTLRSDSFAHLQRLCLRFHGQFTSGFIYERVFGNSINTLGSFMQGVFATLVTCAVGLLFSLFFCLYFSWMLTLIILTGVIAYVMLARFLSSRIYSKTRAANEAGMDVVNVIMDKLRGQKTIQALAIEDQAQEDLGKQLRPAMNKWMESVLESMKLGFATEGIGYVLTAIVTVAGGLLVIRDEIAFPMGTLVAFLGYQGTLISMISGVTNIYGQAMSARSAFDQLFSILDTASTVTDMPGAAMPETFIPRLSFRNVTFAYSDQPVLKQVSFDIPEHRTVALVGRSGSGKSTLAHLMLRLYDPQEGAVLLDGHDIRTLPQRAYRAQFGVVLQDPFMFDTTIEKNLRMVHPNATEAELREVLEKAGAWQFISEKPDGLSSRVGEGGSQLSGGQRQRLAIARCLLTHSKIVILDEATSALDVETEEVVQEGIDALCESRTVIIIAHRLSTIRNAHRIVMLDEGRVIEEGGFDELIQRGGHFARLYEIATRTHKTRIE